MRLSGLSRAETVKESHLLMEFWPSIGDSGFNVGNTKVASIRNPKWARDKNFIYGGMFVTRIAWSFGLLTNEMRDALIEEEEKANEDAEREAANEEAGGSAKMYWNMSQRDWQVFSTLMAFEGNTCDLGSFREETNNITDLHQFHEEVLLTESRDGVADIKRRHRDLSSGGVRDLTTTSRRGRLKEDIESST
uniref:Uncharacterized protein n=1 Tax=Tanacetum cinerariifolium TaxID=118510 RepID=A0A699HPU3_TANCI|nr:hypothetical protein [Tanacetum cinerariifolium]